MRLARIAIITTPLFLLGCEKIQLFSVESAASDLQECLVSQIVPGECDEEKKDLEIALLEAKRDGIKIEKIDASKSIGKMSVDGSPDNSVFSKISRSLRRDPYNITPEYENYSPYLEDCPDMEDIEEMTDYFVTKGKYYQIIGYRVEAGIAKFILVSQPKPCMEENEDSIDTKFPFLTKNQVEKLKNGDYVETHYGADYSQVEVFTFHSFEKAKNKFDEISGE